MKTDASADLGQHALTADHPLNQLLRRSAQRDVPERAEGLAIGQLEPFDADGNIRVSIEAFGLTALPASSMVALAPANVGQPVVLGFQMSDPRRPIVLGLLLTAAGPRALNEEAKALPEVRQVGGRVIVEAQGELELRCGEAVILLEADGKITIRGVSVTSHASANQRIRGGSVQIN